MWYGILCRKFSRREQEVEISRELESSVRATGKDREGSCPSAHISGLHLRLELFALCMWGKIKQQLAKTAYHIWAFLDGSSPTPTFCELFCLFVLVLIVETLCGSPNGN